MVSPAATCMYKVRPPPVIAADLNRSGIGEWFVHASHRRYHQGWSPRQPTQRRGPFPYLSRLVS